MASGTEPGVKREAQPGAAAPCVENPVPEDHSWTETSSELLAAIVTASDDAIVSKSLDGTILSWNRGAERIFGYTAAEVIGSSINVIIPEHLRSEERSILERLRQGERIDHFETTRITRDGRLIQVSLTVSPVLNASGRIIGASKVARDITERKLIEQALQASEERFRELANNIDQFAWTCDKLGMATWYNERWYEYTGTSFQSMRGNGWRSVHHPDHVQRVQGSLMRSVRSEQPWEETFPLRGRDGQYRWFLSRAVPIRDAAGRVIRWFGTNTDITAQRELEIALRQADQRKNEFLATLSHELRNPLAPITNSLEMLRQADDDPDMRRESREIIGRQVTHLVRLVDDLLDVSRISRDRLELRKTSVELGELIREVVGVWRPIARNDNQSIEVATPPQPIHLQADPVRLAQVLNNLLNNACKFSPPGAVVRVTAARDGDQARVTVADHGVGIPRDKLATIFDMFAQAIPSSGEPATGLGIGLTLVKRLVELHGGSISAHSAGPRQGSEFVMCLPATASAREASDGGKPEPEADTRTRLRILVVDDNVDNAESLSMLLEIDGHETAIAFDGEAAVRTARAFRPDTVLLDLGLPKLDGIEVCRLIRNEPWGRDLQIVAVTGWGQEEDRRQSEAAGFDAHLVKPVSHIELRRLLSGKNSAA